MKMLRIPLLMMGLLMCAQGFAATAQQKKNDHLQCRGHHQDAQGR